MGQTGPGPTKHGPGRA